MALRIGLLGAGRIGKVHASAIGATPGATLTAVADFVPAAAQSLADAHGASVRSVDEILAAADIDAVFITSPTDTHADLIIASAEAGKAIFCEKPIDLSAARVRECLAVVERTGATLMVGFNRRFDPNFRSVRRQIDAGLIGEVEMVTIISRDPGPPPLDYMARSGGLLRDMTIHDFDMARYLLGEEPVAVFAAGSVLVDPAIATVPDIDSAMVTLVTASGRLAQISNSRRATYGYDQRIEVHGSKGMARADNIYETTAELANGDGYTRAPLMNFFLERYMPAYIAEVAAFVDSVTNGLPPTPNGHDGLQALLLADAANESIATGRQITVDPS
ncbi:MAG: inositol 2-dehydrogenase [Actinomycetota bacterium]|jgi:myo-inositol 2-dehydrogenase / D-chiro-inositol 1-dehydrogenase